MTIKEASRITGVSTDNLRYYERIGLIPKIKKNESGIRDYDDADIGMIELVVRFKIAGMKLSAIREYVDLAMSGEDTAEARRKILVEARDDLVERLEEIRKSIDIMNYKIERYDQKCAPVTDEIIQTWKQRGNAQKTSQEI